MHSHKSEYKMSTACAFCLCAGFNGQIVQKLNWSAEIFLCMRNFLRLILQCKFIIFFSSFRILSTATRIRNMNSLHGAIRKNILKISGLKIQWNEDYLKREYAEKICLSKTLASTMRNWNEGRRKQEKERGKR